MNLDTKQSNMWRGDFGDAYVDRNVDSKAAIQSRIRAFSEVLSPIQADLPKSILECGANIGINLHALSAIYDTELFAIEPNQKARSKAIATGAIKATNMKDATLAKLPFKDESMDLFFTSGVLIHIHPDNLDQALHEMYRVSKKYILALEYFSHKPTNLNYHGHEELLFKRDFGEKWLDLYPDLKHVVLADSH